VNAYLPSEPVVGSTMLPTSAVRVFCCSVVSGCAALPMEPCALSVMCVPRTFATGDEAPSMLPSSAVSDTSPRAEWMSAAVRSPAICTIAMSPAFRTWPSPSDSPISMQNARAAGSSGLSARRPA